MNGEDKEKNKLKTGAPYFAYELKEEVFPFQNYLAARFVKFLDKRAIETNNDKYLNDLLNKLCAVKH